MNLSREEKNLIGTMDTENTWKYVGAKNHALDDIYKKKNIVPTLK